MLPKRKLYERGRKSAKHKWVWWLSVQQLWVEQVIWCLIGLLIVLWTEQFFEDRTEQLDLVEHDLQELHASIELLVMDRKGVQCICTYLPVSLFWSLVMLKLMMMTMVRLWGNSVAIFKMLLWDATWLSLHVYRISVRVCRGYVNDLWSTLFACSFLHFGDDPLAPIACMWWFQACETFPVSPILVYVDL